MTWEAFYELVTRAPGPLSVVDVDSSGLIEDASGVYIWLRLAGGELGLLEIPMAELARRISVHDVGESVAG